MHDTATAMLATVIPMPATATPMPATATPMHARRLTQFTGGEIIGSRASHAVAGY